MSCPLLFPPVNTGNSLRRGYGVSAAEGGNSSPVNTGVSPPPGGGNFYDARQFPSLTQVVSLSRTIVTIYPFLPKFSATIRPSAVWKI